jgi:hypothetical protein
MLEPRIIQRYYFQRCVVKDGVIFIEAINNYDGHSVLIPEANWPVARNEMYDRKTHQCVEDNNH